MHRPLALSIALALVLPAAVSAAPVSCRLVVDPSGDDRLYNVDAPPPGDAVTRDGDLDILGGDYATDAKNLVVVVRTRTLSGPEARNGRLWHAFFTAAEQRYIVAAAIGPDGGVDSVVYRITGEYGDSDAGAFYAEGIGGAQVTLDLKKHEVVVTAPLSFFTAYTALTKGRVLRELTMWSFRFTGTGGNRVSLPANQVVDYGHGGTGSSVDTATSERTYTAGTKSCVSSPR